MKFSSSSLMALLLLAANDPLKNGITSVSAFASPTTKSRSSIRYSMVADDALLPGSNSKHSVVPPKQRRKHNNKKRKGKKQEWRGTKRPSIPKDVPKLSEVMKGVSVEEFSGDIVVSPHVVPLHNAGQGGNANGERRVHHSERTEQTQEAETPAIHKHARQPQSHQRCEPWRAGYNVSTHTQARIKQAGSQNHRSNSDRASAVLQTLLKTPEYECNEANIVCALTMSAKAMLPSTPITDRFRSMLLVTLDILRQLVADERLNARQLCNAIWAIAKHYNRDPTILPPPPETTAMSSEDMLGVAEAWILQGESDDTAEKRVKDTVDMIAMQLTDILQNEKSRNPKVGELCMASWAYGVLQPRRRPPGWAVPPQISRVPRSKTRARNERNVEFITFEQWAQEDNEEDGFVSPTDCIDRFFDAVGDALCAREEANENGEWTIRAPLMENCSWSEIANVAWAYASHGYCQTPSSEAAMRGLAHEATIRLHESHSTVLPRDVAQLVWAIGTLQSDNYRLGDDLVGLIDAVSCHWELDMVGSSKQRPLHQWNCPDLVQLTISAAHGRIDNRPLLRAVYEEALYRLEEDSQGSANIQRRNFQLWEVSVLLWAQARLYLRESQGKVFEEFASEAPKWLARSIELENKSLEDIGIGAQEQANLAWSLTVLEQYESQEATNLLKSIFQEASASSEKRHFIQLEHAHQLWQALYMLEEDCPSAVEDVPRWFRDYLQEKWTLEKARRKKSSARHRSLSDTLKLMNVAHVNEHDEDIDVAIVLREEASWTHQTIQGDQNGSRHKVAVEFDGPNHFTRETGVKNGEKPRALGHTVLKYRLLKREGWTVVRVPYYEFDKIPFWASMERQRYIQRLLKTHANIRFSTVDVSEYRAPVPYRQTRFD